SRSRRELSIMSDASQAMRRLRTAVLVFLVWYAFFASQAAVSHALSRSPTSSLGAAWRLDVVFALLWLLLTAAIAAWHRRVRARVHSVFAVIALHVPLLFAAAVIDAFVSRAATEWMLGTQQRLSFWALLVFYSDFDIVCYVAVVAVV